MSDALIHRGPDGEGSTSTSRTRVFLAHRRLAILDIAGGEQPMWNEDGQVGVVFNGEIYNHLELRASSSRRGTSSGPTIPTPRCWCTATRSGARSFRCG